MKKVITIIILSLSTSVISQTTSDTTQLFQSVIEMLEESKNNFEYKTGDIDGPQTIGLLKTLLSDSQTKYKYGKINSRINLLLVNDRYSNPTISFGEWIKEDFSKYNSSKYTIKYMGFTYPGDNSETLHIRDSLTGEIIRVITINYSDFNTDTNSFMNLRVISDHQ
jgi:hypothetical protein